MKVCLLHADQDIALRPELRDTVFEAMLSGDLFALTRARRSLEHAQETGSPAPASDSTDALTRDLGLQIVWETMAAGDEFLFEMARRVMLSGLSDPEAIIYRQQVLGDCLEQPDAVATLYGLAVEALENERHTSSLWSHARPDSVLRRSVQVLRLQIGVLRRLRQTAERHAADFRSPGFRQFFGMLISELSDDYLQALADQLRELEFRRGVLESAGLGKGNKGRGYVVRKQGDERWTDRLSFRSRAPSYSFTIPPRDEAGFQALEEVRGRGLNLVADAAAQSADHVKSFFSMLRIELAFYLGCINLRRHLDEKAEPACLPVPLPAGQVALAADGLTDVGLALHLTGPAVGNRVTADGKSLVVITGANQGGKSTLLRSIGLAHLMMACGMFVAARSFRASVCAGIFTHFKREEDATMQSGKLDEELARMSEIAGQITPHSVLLCNESFASTNEREGSQIARQVVRAMLDRQIRVLFVTHMYDLADSFYAQRLETALFLRAERYEDGRRTFQVIPGEPLPTSYGADSYRRVFGVGPGQDSAR